MSKDLSATSRRHFSRAYYRCSLRVRCAKDTGLRNLPLHCYDQNQIWCEIVAPACELLAWMQMLALPRPPLGTHKLRLRLFTCAGRITRGGRRLRLARTWPWAGQITTAITRLQDLKPG